MRTLPFLALLALAWPQSSPESPASSGSPERPAPPFEAFDFEALSRAQAEAGEVWHRFLDRSTLRAGVYRLEAGAADGQSPHAEDEVYYVVRGRAVLEAGGDRAPAAPGSILFVAAGVPHRFVEIEEELEVLVFFSKAPPSDR